ncbi:CMRF35-like molecule 5 [Pungitius pungitius]|uniref:CMRF35-like molecule 5 n=1 Tax=Pungitius pungitius TaxID=134920 RepID=UPI002E0D915D
MKTISVFCYLLYAAGITGASINVEAVEGQEVSFQCSHKYARTNHKYLCKALCKNREDVLVTVHAGGRAASGGITLVDSGDGVFTVTFSHLQLSDLGQYWCAVERLGFDTFTKVQVTVKEAPLTTQKQAVARDTTEATWTYPGTSLSTELTPATDTRWPATLSTGPVLCTTVGTVAALTILMLATVRKCRKNAKAPPKVCSNSPVSAEEGEDDCEYDDIRDNVHSVKTTSGLFSYCPSPKRKPATAVERSVPLPIYENTRRYKPNKQSRLSAAKLHDQYEAISSIYVTPLPHVYPKERAKKMENTHT